MTLRTTVPLVVVPVTVQDREGRPVDGLGEADFLLTDNGKPQRAQVDVSYVPISLVVAVQAGALSGAALEKVRTIGPMVQPLLVGEGGEAAVVAFDNRVTVAQEFTADADLLTRAILGIEGERKGSRLVDAVDRAVEMLESRPRGRRRVVLLVSESKDRGSEGTLQDVVTRAQWGNVVVYPVTYSNHLMPWTVKGGSRGAPKGGLAAPMDLLSIFGELGRMAKENAAEALAAYTGGLHGSFLKRGTLERVVARIGEELHSQYLLTFSPTGLQDGEYHAINVRVKGRSDVTVRARPGYWRGR